MSCGDSAAELEYKLHVEGGEVVSCDSCDFPAPTSGFNWDPPHNVVRERPQRMLCEFCSSTMASRHTAYPSADPFTAHRAELWRIGANIFNMLKKGQSDER